MLESNRLTCRALLGGALGLGAPVIALPRPPPARPPWATVLLDEPIGTIRPGLHGSFTEHIGGVIDDGIWIGPDSSIANLDGLDLADRCRTPRRGGAAGAGA